MSERYLAPQTHGQHIGATFTRCGFVMDQRRITAFGGIAEEQGVQLDAGSDWRRQDRERPKNLCVHATERSTDMLEDAVLPGQMKIGIHCATRFGDKATLLWLAAQMAVARRCAQRRPPVHVAARVIRDHMVRPAGSLS